MDVVILMEWEGVTPAQYDALRKLVNWEGNHPIGGKLHIAAFGPKGLRVTDVWQSAEHCQRFVETRLMPGVKQIGIQGEPKTEIHPLHALFTPALKAA